MFDFHNLKSIATMGLQSLVSLKILHLGNCPELLSFVPKEGLSASLARLVIKGCPILKRKMPQERRKRLAQKIAYIPYMEIDGIV